MAAKRQEPLSITAGDTVMFTRSLGAYLATDGFSIVYEGIGGGSKIEWTSTPNSDGKSHDINIDAATTTGYAAGDYDLSGFAVNAATGERFQFYFGNLNVSLDAQTAQGNAVVTTHAQRMLASLETTLEKMAQHDLNDSSTEGVEFRRKKLEEVRGLRDHYLRERENELQAEAARNGRPSRKKIRLRLMVTNPAGGVMQFGAGTNYDNLPTP